MLLKFNPLFEQVLLKNHNSKPLKSHRTEKGRGYFQWSTSRDDPIYFVRFELPLIPLIDWNLEILHKCHNYFDLYKLLLMSKSILVALFWTPYFFLSALVAFFGLSCPLQSWKHQHTNEKCYQNNILCLVNKNYDFFCNPLINFISNYQI